MFHPAQPVFSAPIATSSQAVRLVSLAQGLYFVITGVWPLFSMRTFERITGPKAAHWLVKTVGLLVAVIGGILILAGVRRRTTVEVGLLGAGSATALAVVDVVYVARERIPPIYLLDALLEAIFVVSWGLTGSARISAANPPHDAGRDEVREA